MSVILVEHGIKICLSRYDQLILATEVPSSFIVFLNVSTHETSTPGTNFIRKFCFQIFISLLQEKVI